MTDHRAAPILVLGGGKNQVGLIRLIEHAGIPVVVADYLDHSPGHRIASHSSFTSTFDSAGAIDVAREYGIQGVITTGTDQPLVTMADVAEALGLPCYLDPEQARLCTDKIRMLRAFSDAGLPVPRYRILREEKPPAEEVSGLAFPLVVKPVDSQGQRGVSVVDDLAGLEAASADARAASTGGRVIAQEFVTGSEITITGWVQDGDFQLGSITDRHTYNRSPATGVCFQHVYPSRQLAEHQSRLTELACTIADVFALRYGPVYIQCIVSDDAVWLVEATCRLGGGHEGTLVEYATGVHFNSQLFDLCLTGESPRMPPLPAFPVPGCYNLINFLLAKPGLFDFIDIATDAPGVIRGGCYQLSGYTQAPIVDGQGRVGFLHCTGDSRAGMLDNARAAYHQCRILDADGENLLFWPGTDDLIL